MEVDALMELLAHFLDDCTQKLMQANVRLCIIGRLAKLSPDALMLIFANPVAVYSSMIERFLGVKALGICGGFNNHRYDLTRLFGKDEYTENCDVVAAGINHMSFILRGTFNGEDIYESIAPKILNDSWQNIFADDFVLHETIDLIYNTYREHKYLIFSSEIDGLFHLAPEKINAVQKKLLPDIAAYNPIEAGYNAAKKVENNFAGSRRNGYICIPYENGI